MRKPEMMLENELDGRPEDMEDEILALDAAGHAIAIELEDDPEEVEEPTDVEYD